MSQQTKQENKQEEEPKKKSLKEIKEKIKEKIQSIFSRHIGKDNPIKSDELFFKVFKFNMNQLSMFEGFFYLRILNDCIKELRREHKIFIVNSGNRYYVLESQQELKEYETKIDRFVKNLKSQKDFARVWVNEKRWKKLV